MGGCSRPVTGALWAAGKAAAGGGLCWCCRPLQARPQPHAHASATQQHCDCVYPRLPPTAPAPATACALAAAPADFCELGKLFLEAPNGPRTAGAFSQQVCRPHGQRPSSTGCSMLTGMARPLTLSVLLPAPLTHCCCCRCMPDAAGCGAAEGCLCTPRQPSGLPGLLSRCAGHRHQVGPAWRREVSQAVTGRELPLAMVPGCLVAWRCACMPPLEALGTAALGHAAQLRSAAALLAPPAPQDFPHQHYRPHAAHVWRQRPRHSATDVPGKASRICQHKMPGIAMVWFWLGSAAGGLRGRADSWRLRLCDVAL